MDGRHALAVGLALALSAPAAQASWAPPEIISPAGWGGRVAMNREGLALASWAEADPSGWGTVGVAVAVKRPGGAWSPPQEIHKGDAGAASLAVGGDGSMYAITQSRGNGDIYLGIAEPGAAFGEPILLSRGGAGYGTAAVAADERGRAVVVFTDGASGDLMAIAREPGQAFGAPKPLGYGGMPALAMDRASGEALLATVTQSTEPWGWHVMAAARPPGGDFEVPTEVPGSELKEQVLTLGAAAGANEALVYWDGFDTIGGREERIHAAILGHGAEPRVFRAVAETPGFLRGSLGDDGTAAIVWGGQFGTPLLAARAPAHAAFGEPLVVAEPNVDMGTPVVDSVGNVLALWSAVPHAARASVLLKDANVFCRAEDITGVGAASPFSLAMDAHGGGIAVFQRMSSSEIDAVAYSASSACPPEPVPDAPVQPLPPAPPLVMAGSLRLGARAVLTRSGRSARVSVECLGPVACRGNLILSVMTGKRVKRSATLANSRFAIAPGARRSLRMPLRPRGIRLLRTRKRMRGTLAARVSGTSAVRQPVVVRR